MIATPLSKLAQAATAMALLAALSAGTANARDRALQNACFPPDALAALSGESVPLKGDHRFDGAEKPVALVPSTPIPQELRGSIRRVELPKGQKLIALTLDLCEDRGEVAGISCIAELSYRILDLLACSGERYRTHVVLLV